MRFLFIAFFSIAFVIPSLLAQKSTADQELLIVRGNKLDFLSFEMDKYYKVRNIDSCLYFIKEIEAISDLTHFKDHYLKATSYKADFLFNQTKYLEADSIYKFILANNPQDNTKAAAHMVRSKIYTTWGRYSEAIDFANLAKDIWSEEEKTTRIIDYYLRMGSIYVRWEKTPQGLEYFLKAYQHSLDNDQKNNLGSILFSIASLYSENNVSDMAIRYDKEANKYNEHPGNSWLVYNEIIGIYNELGIVDSAAIYIDKALAIDTSESFTPHHNHFYCNRCEYYVLKGDYDLALEMGTAALKFTEGRLINYKIPAYECLANLSFAQEEYNTAIKYIDSIETLGIWYLDNDMRELRANSFIQLKKWSEASRELSLIVDEMDKKSGNNDLFEFNNELLSKNFDLEKRDADSEAAKEKKKLLNQRLSTFVMGLLFISALVIVYFFRKLYKKKEAYASIVENQNGALEKMNEFNHRLFYTLGHDLRSPINSLEIIFNEMLKKRISTTDFMGILPTLKKSITGTSLTLNNILQWGLIQNSKVLKDRSMDDVNLHVEALEAEGMLSGSMKLKNIVFQNLIPEDCTILADNYKINLIFRNLISNAIKFTPKGGNIKISTDSQSTAIIIKVKDSGVGIEEDRLKNLFDNKTSTDGTNNEKGFGVGLPLCKEIVLQMNGEIWAESVLGEGSSFFIKIPLDNIIDEE